MAAGPTHLGYTWQYDDLLLLGIVLSVSGGALVDMLTSLGLPCLLAAVLMAHGLFVSGPVDGPGDRIDEVDALD